MAKEITLLKGILRIYRRFIEGLHILTLALIKNFKNEPRFETYLEMNYAMYMCSGYYFTYVNESLIQWVAFKKKT